ncbi:MAG: hypothetical protein KDK36_13330 [Leptospiraceae bacterium]|nr:hypothetical protein [Leptospiraceae bacterium]
MNKDRLLGLETGVATGYWIQILKNTLFLRYGLFEPTELTLKAKESEIVPGLSIISENGDEFINRGLIVGTVRMGYGHHRMAYSLYTWALKMKIKPYLHDILAINCKESTAIKDIDGLYSQMSRASAEMGGVIEWLWGQITSSGNVGSLDMSVQMAEKYTNLLNGIPSVLPYLSTYPLNGQIAAEAGFEKIVHLIPDNFPQYYLLVPKALNLVQSPASYMKFIEMGVPKENLVVAGHWVSEPIAANAIAHSELRLKRAEKDLKKRILFPIGGAGAQKNYLFTLLDSIEDKLKKNSFHLWINTGDHSGLFAELCDKLHSLKLNFKIIETYNDLLEFQKDHDLSDLTEKDEPSITVFNFKNHFEAFSATDVLMLVADILMTKPSELAFFPIPKIFIRRVGDHEAASAFRSMELGEGTTECRKVEHAVEMIQLFTEGKDIFERMNECVIRNSKEGIYDGSKHAVEIATS